MSIPQIENVGAYIRRRVIPHGMSVTEAAKRLCVGRPALSNLLNGKASLSAEMALRLEKAFGADRKDLLDRQATSDRERRSDADRAVAVRRFVPPFLTIEAGQIEAWAGTIKARHLLPVLLRTLINSTGEGLRAVDFPGHDDAQRPGWDGWVEAETATPWIPQGKSGWEFGVNKRPRIKADDAYVKRLSVPSTERARCTFVFVTPHRWPGNSQSPGKDQWAKKKSEAGDWKAVRAYDASDLEQWLEQSIAGQVWLAGQLAHSHQQRSPELKCETVYRFWERWRGASEPPMTDKIFAPSIAAHVDRFGEWLISPKDRPLYVAADSTEEAVAFLACLFRQPGVPARERDLAVLFDSPDTLRSLAMSPAPFIPIVRNADAERELAPLLHRRRPCIAVRRSNTAESCEPDITVEMLGHEAFRQALADMGLGDDVGRLARESGRSPTILRRRLSKIDAIRMPPWVEDPNIARSLIPMALVGAWHAESNADRKVLSALAGCTYETIEQNVTYLRQRADPPPVWSVGEHRGVASRIDALFGISGHLIKDDIERFLESAETVLSEPDPELELPEDQRWAAARHGKVRAHSPEVRSGVCETLVLLAIHGNHLLQNRLGIDLEEQVDAVIGKLLAPLTLDGLLSHHHDLPWYAEAAPDRLLSLLEYDLRRSEPVLQRLLKPAEGGCWLGFPRPRRIGLLQALEYLAWSPDHFPRASRILAQLAGTNIDDNLAHTPFSSLAGVYQAWMPQTAAPMSERIRGMEMLSRSFPDIGWHICMEMFEQRRAVSSRPRWRDYAAGFGSEVPKAEFDRFTRGVIDIALAWPQHDQHTLGDLVERHQLLRSDRDREHVWKLVDDYARTETDDRAKAALRMRITRLLSAQSWRWRSLREHMTDADRARARNAHVSLTPRDPAIRHAWMFSKAWVEGLDDATDDGANDDGDWLQAAERARRRRTDAIAEIWRDRGWNGLFRLLIDGDSAQETGACAARRTRGREVEILSTCLSCDGVPAYKVDGFMQGYLSQLDERARVLSAVARNATAAQIARLFRCAPLGAETWRLLDRQMPQVRKRYWSEVTIGPITPSLRLTDAELAELVDGLLLAARPRAAFHCVLWVDGAGERLETPLLSRLLTDVATVHGEPDADRYDISRADLSDALESLDHRTGVARDEMAQLEFLFIHALDDRFNGNKGHGIPNLERVLVDFPSLFAQAIALVYRRTDDRPDPPEMRFKDAEHESAASRNAYALLKRLWRIPGTDDGTVDAELLYRWCIDVRRRCSDLGRADVGDYHIGELLSHAPVDDEGRWPCGPVCEVMERIASPRVEAGFQVAAYNARGPQWRGMEEGGNQERATATTFRRDAQRLAFDYPWVSSVLGRMSDLYEREATEADLETHMRKRLVD